MVKASRRDRLARCAVVRVVGRRRLVRHRDVQPVSAAGASPLTPRADSGFYSSAVAGACRRAGVRFSITVKLSKALRKTIAAIDDQAWTAIPYFLDGADVAETTYRPFGNKHHPYG